MSLIDRILKPRVPNALIADSLPTPGPLTKTLTSRNPSSMAFFVAFSAVVWAAKGVDFLAPLNPKPPEEAHEMAFPARSVIVIIVLLNVA